MCSYFLQPDPNHHHFCLDKQNYFLNNVHTSFQNANVIKLSHQPMLITLHCFFIVIRIQSNSLIQALYQLAQNYFSILMPLIILLPLILELPFLHQYTHCSLAAHYTLATQILFRPFILTTFLRNLLSLNTLFCLCDICLFAHMQVKPTQPMGPSYTSLPQGNLIQVVTQNESNYIKDSY